MLFHRSPNRQIQRQLSFFVLRFLSPQKFSPLVSLKTQSKRMPIQIFSSNANNYAERNVDEASHSVIVYVCLLSRLIEKKHLSVFWVRKRVGFLRFFRFFLIFGERNMIICAKSSLIFRLDQFFSNERNKCFSKFCRKKGETMPVGKTSPFAHSQVDSKRNLALKMQCTPFFNKHRCST